MVTKRAFEKGNSILIESSSERFHMNQLWSVTDKTGHSNIVNVEYVKIEMCSPVL